MVHCYTTLQVAAWNQHQVYVLRMYGLVHAQTKQGHTQKYIYSATSGHKLHRVALNKQYE